MHVVKEQAQAGQQPQQQQGAEAEKPKTSALFWLLIGGVGGAVAMHLVARKMQEYAGGVYSKRAELQARMQMMGMGGQPGYGPGMGYGGPTETVVDLDDDDGGGGLFG